MRDSHRRIEDLYEARIQDLKDAHDQRVKELMRTIEALAEQVEYLRAQLSPVGLAPRGERPIATAQADHLNQVDDLWVSEEEEDLRALHAAGHISLPELEAALEAAGLSPSIT